MTKMIWCLGTKLQLEKKCLRSYKYNNPRTQSNNSWIEKRYFRINKQNADSKRLMEKQGRNECISPRQHKTRIVLRFC